MRKVPVVSILAGLLWMTGGCHSNNAPSAPSTTSTAGEASPRPAVSDTAPDESDSTARVAPVQDSNDKRPVLVCFGDSLTAGYGAGAGQSYPDYLQADLDKLHFRYRVVNKGVSGNTTKDGAERLPEVLALHPAVAVVEFGGNDGLRGLRIDDTRKNLDEIVRTLQGAGIKIALAGITLPPDYGEDYIKQFDDTYTMLAKKYRAPMLPFLLKDVYGLPGMMQRDGIHATAKGNVVVAQNVERLVLPLLKK